MRHEESLPGLLGEHCPPEAESAHPAPTEVSGISKGLCSLCKGACAVVTSQLTPNHRSRFSAEFSPSSLSLLSH